MTQAPPPALAGLLDRTFGHPRGPFGRFGAAVMARGNRPTERHVVDVAHLSSNESVLVVGPGPGVGVAAAAERAATVIAVDPSEDMLRQCRQRCPDAALEVRTGTASDTGQASSSVEVVLSVNNLHIWDDRAAGFAELHRVLRPGGRLIISAHEKWLPVSRHTLAEELEAAGFTGVQTWVWDPPGIAAARAAQLRAYRQ